MGERTIRDDLTAQHVVISDEMYQRALYHTKEGTLEMIEYLIEREDVAKQTACRVWSNRIGVAYVDPLSTVTSPDAVANFPVEIARKARAIPLYEVGGALTVAMPDPKDEVLVRRLSAIAGKTISPVFCLSSEVRDAIEVHYTSEESVHEFIAQLERTQGTLLAKLNPDELAGESGSRSIITLLDSLIYLAVKERASDIHIEPGPDNTSIRFRIDGRLQKLLTLSSVLHSPLKSRVKILCNMNVAETRLPQDGRYSLPLGSGEVNLRISIIPTSNGEKIVIRLLALTGKKDFLTLDQMFVSQSIIQPFKRIIQSPNGLIFVTGPTGSGKSTTLYAALHEINQETINICTIEDPVETKMDGINQTQVHKAIDLNFSTLLRSLLRQDPDVILVGEIRDLETAKIATEAALTGHLVFSTLHTNNAIQAVVRLTELGIEPYMVAPSLLAVIGQRLAARICEACKQAYSPSADTIERFFYDTAGIKEPFFYQGTGCSHCRNTGYRGRVAFHEMALITDEIRTLILRREGDAAIAEAAKKVGYRPLRYDGLKKVLLGFTTVEELESHAAFDWVASGEDAGAEPVAS